MTKKKNETVQAEESEQELQGVNGGGKENLIDRVEKLEKLLSEIQLNDKMRGAVVESVRGQIVRVLFYGTYAEAKKEASLSENVPGNTERGRNIHFLPVLGTKK